MDFSLGFGLFGFLSAWLGTVKKSIIVLIQIWTCIGLYLLCIATMLILVNMFKARLTDILNICIFKYFYQFYKPIFRKLQNEIDAST